MPFGGAFATGDFLSFFGGGCRTLRSFGAPFGDRLLVMLPRHERSPDDEGLTEGASIAFVPMKVEIYRSTDQGLTWTGPEKVDPPIADTAFELCSLVEVLADGTMIWPTSTWPTVGQEVNAAGFRAGLFVSRDQGKSWRNGSRPFPMMPAFIGNRKW